jgi:hypothetical protein
MESYFRRHFLFAPASLRPAAYGPPQLRFRTIQPHPWRWGSMPGRIGALTSGKNSRGAMRSVLKRLGVRCDSPRQVRGSRHAHCREYALSAVSRVDCWSCHQPPPPPTVWTIYKPATKRTRVGEVEAATESEAIEKTAAEFGAARWSGGAHARGGRVPVVGSF